MSHVHLDVNHVLPTKDGTSAQQVTKRISTKSVSHAKITAYSVNLNSVPSVRLDSLSTASENVLEPALKEHLVKREVEHAKIVRKDAPTVLTLLLVKSVVRNTSPIPRVSVMPAKTTA